jgi:hypothetical protein
MVPKMPAGWNVRVTTFDSEGKPRIVRNFLAYEADEERAVELVRKRVPVNEGELAEAVAEVTENQFCRPRDEARRRKAASYYGRPRRGVANLPRMILSKREQRLAANNVGSAFGKRSTMPLRKLACLAPFEQQLQTAYQPPAALLPLPAGS